MATKPGSAPSSQTDDVAPPREFELITADMETRLRSTILRIIRPALDQMSDISARLEGIGQQVFRLELAQDESLKNREAINEQSQFTKLVSDRVEEFDAQLRKLERVTSSGIAELKSGSGEFERSLEQQKSLLQRQAREISRVWEETARLQEQHDEAKLALWEGVAAANKKAERSRDECMEQMKGFQVQHDALVDDLFGEGKGLTKAVRDLALLTQFVQPLPEIDARVTALAEQTAACEKGQEDVNAYCLQNQHDMEQLYATMDQKLRQMKEDSKQESNRLISHHASMMKDIRRDYAEEIQANRHIREEITQFQRSTDDFCQELADAVKSESRRIDAIHREIVQDMDEIQKRRRKDRAAIETDLKDTRKQVAIEQEVSKEVRNKVEYLGRILGLVLEGERLSSAMLIQDYSDRSAERWLGLPDDLGRQAQPPQRAEGLEFQRQRDARKRVAIASEDLVSIDWRKGLSKTKYLPGPVAHEGHVYERCDLLLLHHKLLERAHSAFVDGPVAVDISEATSVADGLSAPVSADTVPAQPGARGGVEAGGRPNATTEQPEIHAKVVDAMKASPPSGPPHTSRRPVPGGAPSGSRQRPGSQGQPEAMGSRGGMSGPLGETSPPRGGSSSSAGSFGEVLPPTVPTVRLPTIGGVGGAGKAIGRGKGGEASSVLGGTKSFSAR